MRFNPGDTHFNPGFPIAVIGVHQRSGLLFRSSRDVRGSPESPHLAFWGKDVGDEIGRAAQAPDEPAVGSTGWKCAAPQPVILKERPLSPRMKDLNRRSPLRSPLPISFSQRPYHTPPPGLFSTFVTNKALS
jgi:hypothetical protein